MSIFFDVAKSEKGKAGYVRVGLESDKDFSQSFAVASAKEGDIPFIAEMLQRYTKWLDQRELLALPVAQKD